ncbi:MAG: hypothetical protein DWQ31_20360 [Planctomycetota bacterium]|nr:MAG: hypothetical protein DWQ31_20360 [Planctomycetota bacterium]REJ96495.1 MAG: hypothetical protein DWQ35_04655 [Planctomycetota bacterium]REK25143.1 MAG: hypothetical protein DWQ42_12245 [Planctomycetota bacterium]REK40534.1 MAG: hypothetical protein DWQ46_16175 [Planctomycetota bacterium]
MHFALEVDEDETKLVKRLDELRAAHPRAFRTHEGAEVAVGLDAEHRFVKQELDKLQEEFPDALSVGEGAEVAVGLVPENRNIQKQFEELERRYPEAFAEHFGEVSDETCAQALRLGRQVYIGEGCWHCHSQFIRPVSNESLRWGSVAASEEYDNELQKPVLFGTRRVGPDLSRQGGRHGHDWHAVHLFEPTWTSPGSPMPSYPWFFDGSPEKPNRRGLALITYLQWLGSWLDEYPYYEEFDEVKGGQY